MVFFKIMHEKWQKSLNSSQIELKNSSVQLGDISKQPEEQWSQKRKTAAVRSLKSKGLPREIVTSGAEIVATNSATPKDIRAQDVGENELRARIRQLRHVEKRNPVEKQQKYASLLRMLQMEILLLYEETLRIS